jgi:signal recognition particle GTPase
VLLVLDAHHRRNAGEPSARVQGDGGVTAFAVTKLDGSAKGR